MSKTKDSYSASLKHRTLVRTIICILFCVIALGPFLLLVMNATRSSDAIKSGISLIPSTHFLENWKNLMIKQNGMQITLQRAALNSLTITVPGTILSVYFSSLTAYGIFVYDFKLKKLAWAFIMAIMMVPSQISIIGFYRFMLDLKLVDTYIPLIIPTIATPAVVFFMKQYMESTLSIEMIEAARIDGSGELHTFNRIIMPIMKPAYASMAVLVGMGAWNGLLWPLLVISSMKKYTIPLGLNTLFTPYGNNYDLMITGSCFAILPLLLLYLLAQRFIIEGMTAGSVKG